MEPFKAILQNIDYIYSSELKRAVNSAELVLGCKLPVAEYKDGYEFRPPGLHYNFKIDKRFNEFDLGQLEGLHVGKMSFDEQNFLNKL